MQVPKPTFSGVGTLQQLGTLCAILAGLYSIYNAHDAERVAQAAAQGAQKEAVQRLRTVEDYLPAMRRDIETDYRRDIDSACRCCRS